MAVVLEDVLLAEDPLSPEVVLVSPPEIAHLARARPSRGRWEDAVCSARIDERVQAQPSFVLRNAGVWGFYLFCLAMTVGPMALAVLLGRN